MEALLVRWAGEAWTFRIWRSILYTATFLSMLRQAQIHYPDPFWYVMARIPLLPVVVFLSLLLFLLCLRSRRLIHRYAGFVGILSVVLTLHFIVRTEALARGWRHASGDATLPPRAAEAPPIYLLVFDALSSEMLLKGRGIDAEAFPNFAALAGDGAWFPNATTNHFLTRDAVPTMFSGHLYPPPKCKTLFDRLPQNYDVVLRVGPVPAYRWLRKHVRDNHRIECHSWSEWLIHNPLEIPPYLALTLSETPYSQSPFQGQKSRRLLLPILWANGANTMVHAADIDEFLDDVRKPMVNPRIIYWHCLLPHYPFVYAPDGSKHGRPNVALSKAPRWYMASDDEGEYSVEAVLNNYRDQIRYVDSLLGRFVRTLKREGLYDRAVVIVTSDHGIRTFGELEPPGYPKQLGHWTPRIPLFVKAPGVKPGRYEVDYQHIDLVATLLEVLGCPGRAGDTEGVSAFDPVRPRREKVIESTLPLVRTDRYVYDAQAGLWRLTSRAGE